MFWHKKKLVVYSILTNNVFSYKNAVINIKKNKMQIFSIYLLIGLVLTIAASELNKIPSHDSDEIMITNSDRLVYILLWPIIILYVIYKLKK